MKQHAEIFFFSLHGSSNVQLEIFIRPVALLFFFSFSFFRSAAIRLNI